MNWMKKLISRFIKFILKILLQDFQPFDEKQHYPVTLKEERPNEMTRMEKIAKIIELAAEIGWGALLVADAEQTPYALMLGNEEFISVTKNDLNETNLKEQKLRFTKDTNGKKNTDSGEDDGEDPTFH